MPITQTILQSPEDLIDYACRKLGAPVINIEVDTTQANDRVDDALQMFMQRHYHAVEEVWQKVTFTQGDIDRGYKTLDEKIVAVVDLVEHDSNSLDPAWTTVEYQMRQYGMMNIFAPDIVTYTLTMQYITLINDLLTPRRSFQFNKYNHQLRITGTPLAGDFVIIHAYKMLDPNLNIEIYNDEWLKKYTTALIKQQWGTNLKKFEGVQMPGGVTLNGQKIWDEATEEIQKLEEEFSSKYELPVDMMIG